jgi:hypothetical protein
VWTLKAASTICVAISFSVTESILSQRRYGAKHKPRPSENKTISRKGARTQRTQRIIAFLVFLLPPPLCAFAPLREIVLLLHGLHSLAKAQSINRTLINTSTAAGQQTIPQTIPLRAKRRGRVETRPLEGCGSVGPQG